METLEQIAIQKAERAVQLDKKGSTEAIGLYTDAIEILTQLNTRHPMRVYQDLIADYKKRIRDLQFRVMHPSAVSEEEAPKMDDKSILVEKPGITWEDIADLVDAKEAIKDSIIYPTRRPDLFPLGWPRGILLYGPPGCGKTLLVAAAATELDAVFYRIDSAAMLSKWFGESEKNVAQLFRTARDSSDKGKAVVIYIDEVDSIAGKRSEEMGSEIRVRNQLLSEMDGLQEKGKGHLIYVIGATNKPWDLDLAFIRRFQRRIYIPLPNAEARSQLIRVTSKSLKLSEDVDLGNIVGMTEGFSGSDMRDIFQVAQLRVAKEFFNSKGAQTDARPINMNDLVEILKDRKPSVSKDVLWYYDKWSREYAAL